jgi:3',5'-cyclic AMP phosphodiesterase CpdA
MTFEIAQITDTHLSEDFPQRTADLALSIAQINALDAQPKAVVHTGDIADYGKTEQYSIARSELDTLRAPYFVLAGNRDDREQMRKAFADNQLMTFESEFIQYAIDQFSTRIIVLDTLCIGSNKGQLCESRLEQFEAMLAADTSKPVAIFMHHPPFEAHEIPDPVQFLDWADVEKFIAIIKRYENISAIFCGHLHRTISSQAGGIEASSISCMAGDLRRGDVSDAQRKEPMFRSLTLS